jgi:hypothetical protein
MRNYEGWTDDFNFPMASGRTVEELVDYVLQAAIQRYTNSTVIQKLISDFGLTEADAGFALDRALGGVVRAATVRASNCPAKEKDPVAWSSFQRCIKSPDLIAAIYPQFSRRVHKS